MSIIEWNWGAFENGLKTLDFLQKKLEVSLSWYRDESKTTFTIPNGVEEESESWEEAYHVGEYIVLFNNFNCAIFVQTNCNFLMSYTCLGDIFQYSVTVPSADRKLFVK